jgi:hypothetical protein
MAPGSYSIVQAKGLPGLFGAQRRLTTFQPRSRHLGIIDVFDTGLDKLTRKIALRQPPAFCQLGEPLFDIGV